MAIVALGAGLVLLSTAAQAQNGTAVREPRRVIIATPPAPTPWDYNIIPRYQFRPGDDRVDPCGGPVVPVIRYGSQEVYIAPWVAAELGLGRIHGRDWPCGGRRARAY
ncbi:hypothetical protein [Bradyrhizobium sp. SYSU BS000235]|uniref:hypothetical protein n=1 Tax=Bradyrhizobium sp. SYSU BS000235 TaxID=3411332 RepID=UPI003C7076D0